MKNVRESVDDEFIDPMIILFERMDERTLVEKFADAKFTDLASTYLTWVATVRAL